MTTRGLPALVAVLCVLVLVADYLTGPAIQFPIAFTIPVALLSWYSHRAWALALAVVLPLARTVFHAVWVEQLVIHEIAVNTLIRIAVLVCITLLIDHVVSLNREVETLRGILPICSGCKRIRNGSGNWSQIESYIAEHTHAEFSHGLCPECMKRLYPEYSGRIEQERKNGPGR